MTTPWSAKCACGHLVDAHQLFVSSKREHRGPCTAAGCNCRGPR